MDAGAGECAEPEAQLDHLTADRDPLGFGAFRNQAPVDARGEFDPGGQVSGQTEGGLERWRPVCRICQPFHPVPACGVEVHAVESGQVERASVGVHHGCVRPGGEVVCCDRGGHLVALDGSHPEFEGGNREGVAADAATEVRDTVDSRRPESPGVDGRHGQSCRLFQASRGEQHPVGERPELGLRPPAQFRLVEHSRDQSGRVPGRPQFAHRAHDIGGGVVWRQRVQQPQPVDGQHLDQLRSIHPPHSPRNRRVLPHPGHRTSREWALGSQRR